MSAREATLYASSGGRSRRRRSRRRKRGGDDGIELAHQRAHEKAKAARDLLHCVIVVGALSIFIPGVAWIVGLIWGLSIAHDVVHKLIEPELRQRWVEREVRGALDETVRAERDRLQGDHSRHLEALAAGVAKEIRDPLAAAKGLVSQMGEDPKANQNIGHAKVALGELERVEASIAHLLRFARDEHVQCVPTQVSEVLRAAAGALRDRAEEEGVALVPVIDAEGWIDADPKPLAQAIANLVAHSMDAVATVPHPRVDLECGENLAGTEVWVRIADNGRGRPDSIDRWWVPFGDTGDDPRLSMAYARKAIEAQGGTIDAEHEEDGGASFVITFARLREEDRRQG